LESSYLKEILQLMTVEDEDASQIRQNIL